MICHAVSSCKYLEDVRCKMYDVRCMMEDGPFTIRNEEPLARRSQLGKMRLSECRGQASLNYAECEHLRRSQ